MIRLPPALARPRVVAALAGVVAGMLAGSAGAQSITDALSKAYLTSPDLRAARRALDAANEQRPQALANWMPRVTIGPQLQTQMTTQPNRLSVPYVSSAFTAVQGPGVTASLQQPITQGGGEWSRLAQAEALIRQARANLLNTEQTVLFNAAQADLDVYTAARQVQYRIEARDALRQVTEAMDRLLAVQDVTEADTLFSRSRLAAAEANLAQTRAQLDEARARYRQVVGSDPPAKLDSVPPLTVLPQRLGEAVAAAAESNPSVVATYYADLAARQGINVATAALLPTLAFTAQYTRNWSTYNPDLAAAYGRARSGNYSSGQLTLQMQIPLYQGGAEYATVRQAKKQELQQRSLLESARRQAISTVEQVWNQRIGDVASVAALEVQSAALTRTVADYRRALGVGLRTVLEILDSLQDLANAEVQLAQTRESRILDDYNILQGMGGLTARTLGLPVPYYDPDGDYQRTRWRLIGLSVNSAD